MSALNSIIKAVEQLKGITDESNQNTQDARKKEKIGNCLAIAKGVSSYGDKTNAKYTGILSLSVQTLLSLCDDSDTDVRTVADECLNRVIRSTADGSIVKVQIELYYEIKRNGAERSLRAALWRFALLSHMIKPIKGKAYVSKLLPCIVAIAERTEESVINTLVQSLPLILKCLGRFMNDSDVKTLLKAFIDNLSSSQAAQRRAAAELIVATCLNCRKPLVFLCQVLHLVADSMPVEWDSSNSMQIVGGFGCLKAILPHINEPLPPDLSSLGRLEGLTLVYELCLTHAKCSADHNVVNAALETLVQLLKSPATDFVEILTCESGLIKRKLPDDQVKLNFDLTTSTHSENMMESTLHLIESDLTDIAPKIEKWMMDSKLTMTSDAQGSLRSAVSAEVLNSTGNDNDNSNSLAASTLDLESIGDESDMSSCDLGLDKKTQEKNSETFGELDIEDERFSDDITSSVASPHRPLMNLNKLDIGSLTDEEVPLKYCCRLLASSFLLTGVRGEVISDQAVRVSVKSLALTSLGLVFRIQPTYLFTEVTKVHSKDVQKLTDIILLHDHNDPQIRGNLSVVLSSFVKALITRHPHDFRDILTLSNENDRDFLAALVDLLIKGLKDESATTCRLTLIALQSCLPDLVKSSARELSMKIVRQLSTVAENPYFLVRIKLVELLSMLPYTTIENIVGDSRFQDNFLHLIFAMLNDRDQRVRHATCTAIVKIIPNLYYQQPGDDAISVSATDSTNSFLSHLLVNPQDRSQLECELKSLLETSISPFCELELKQQPLEDTLSIMIDRLLVDMTKSMSKQLTLGCCEALYLLSEEYLTTVYPKAWDCIYKAKKSVKSSGKGTSSAESTDLTSEMARNSKVLLSSMAFLLTSSPLTYDLSTHKCALLLAGNIISALGVFGIKSNNTELEGSWIAFGDKCVTEQVEKIFTHVIKVLKIFAQMIDERSPPKSSSFHAQNLSPRKKFESMNLKKEVFKSGAKKKEFQDFRGEPHYAKFQEIISSAHNNYKVTLEASASEMYLSLLNSALRTLSQILEITKSSRSASVAEDILDSLQVAVLLAPIATVKCVRQLLKSLYGVNLAAKIQESDFTKFHADRLKSTNEVSGFYGKCFLTTARQMSDLVKAVGENCRGGNEPDTGWSRLGQRKSERKFSSLLKARQPDEKTSLMSLIKLFEPVVIKSLRNYTINSSIPLQCEVLMLLSQLVQLCVNYCLLDSDKVFIDFVIKQFGQIEEGYISQTQLLLPKIFDFLVRLSHEKYQTKIIIGVPKILQLCDGLIASGQPPLTHSIPALVPVVEDIFITRSKVSSNSCDLKELETTREVLMTMLLKLIEHHEVLELVTLCLIESRFNGDGEDKWRRWSRLATDAILPSLAAGRVQMESADAHLALIKFIAAVSPTVFRPVDPLLKVLFASPPSKTDQLPHVQRWLGTTNVILVSLVALAKEEAMLARLNDLTLPSGSGCDPSSFDPLNVTRNSMKPEVMFAKFMMDTARLIAFKIEQLLLVKSYSEDLDLYLIHQFAFFLQLCAHTLESGSHCKVAEAATKMIRKDSEKLVIEELNFSIMRIAHYCPTIACQWVHLLALLSYSDMSFWTRILSIEDNDSLNMNVIKRGGIIMFCDYVCENFLTDAEPLTWLLANRIEETVKLTSEPPVKELLTVAVHRNPAASGLLIQAIATKCLNLDKPAFVRRLLQCLEGAHYSLSGPLILALIPRFLESKYLAVTRIAANIATRRAEVLLTFTTEQVQQQLNKSELMKLMDTLQNEKSKLAKRYSGFVSLLNKIGAQHYDLTPLELDQGRPFNPSLVKSTVVDRNWFLSQVKQRCCYPSNNTYGHSETAQLFSNLNEDDCLNIFTSKDFSLNIIKDCISLGVKLSLEQFNKLDFAATSNDQQIHYSMHPLYQSAIKCLLQNVKNIVKLTPRPHQVLYPKDSPSNKEIKYAQKFEELMEDQVFRSTLLTTIPSVHCYLKELEKLNKYNLDKVDCEFEEDLARFGILCLEVAHTLVKVDCAPLKPHELDICLECADQTLKNSQISKACTVDSWICSMSNCLVRIVENFSSELEHLPAIDGRALESLLASQETKRCAEACLQTASLISWLETRQCKTFPAFLLGPIRGLTISLARQPLVNSFALTPPIIWSNKHFSTDDRPRADLNFPVVSDPILRDLEVMEEFYFRISLLGWTSRQQFEEIWMALLSVLNAFTQRDTQAHSETLVRVTCLAVRAITTLFVQTLLLPCIGNPGNSALIHHPRDPQLSLRKSSTQKLFSVQELLSWRWEKDSQIFSRGNIDRTSSGDYDYEQLSVTFLWSLCCLREDKLSSSVIVLKNQRNDALVSMALDVNSCLRFLVELYSSWYMPQVNTPIRLLTEITRSTLIISDMFAERTHYQWMLDVCLDIVKSNNVQDNKIFQQYLILAVCKAAAVLTPLDIETLSKVVRLMDAGLKSDFLPTNIFALHGVLYLLQSAVLANCEETMNAVHPLSIEYIQRHMDSLELNLLTSTNEFHQGIMWALVFFLLEHAEDTPPDSEAPAVLELVLTLVNKANISSSLHRTLLQGLERLIATRCLTGKVMEQVVKVAIDRLRLSSTEFSVPALRLLLTCMYTEFADRFNQPQEDRIGKPLPDIEPDALVKSIERTSAIFDRIRRGYAAEVEVLSTVLSAVLVDFFQPFDIMTKVIGEFLSSQQPHPKFMSAVVFKICEGACSGSQLSLLQDWVVFSLPNFIQSLPIGMSTWCLACFFISASTNPWLRAIFPHVQSRIGKYEYEDKKLLCIAASDFYHKLSNASQKKAFVETFEAAAKEPKSPFADILSSL